jgi:hypothetical protein
MIGASLNLYITEKEKENKDLAKANKDASIAPPAGMTRRLQKLLSNTRHTIRCWRNMILEPPIADGHHNNMYNVTPILLKSS